MKTGKAPIFYTSADSVFQICHEETFGLDKLTTNCAKSPVKS